MLRDLTSALLDEGLAFQTLASHDAQSVAGILSTDVHGTGREPAHPSDRVVAMDLVDGTGTLHENLTPDDDRFRAAVGGLGAVGIITKVTFQCVDAFHLRQGTHVEARRWAATNLDDLFAEHRTRELLRLPVHRPAPRPHLDAHRRAHVTARRVPRIAQRGQGGDRRRHPRRRDGALGPAAEDCDTHDEAAARRPGWCCSHTRRSAAASTTSTRSSRSPYRTTGSGPTSTNCSSLYERRAADQRLPFLLVEVRFSPGPHDTTLLGAGAGRDTAWLCLCCNQSGAVGDYFADVEEWVSGHDARIHLGKWCEDLDADDVARMHGDRFERFRDVRDRLDPDRRFANPFTERVLGASGGG